MKISRWIYVPLFVAVFYALAMWSFGQTFNLGSLLFCLIAGAVLGLLGIYTQNTKARAISKAKDERAFDVCQNRTIVVLTNYETAFKLCRESLLSLKGAKIKNEDFQNGALNAVNGSVWSAFLGSNFWGTIDFSLKKLNENLIEIDLSINPKIKTMVVSDGQSWKIAEDICDYIKDKDAKLNKKVLTDSLGIMEDVYIKPFQKEKVER